MSLLIIPPTKNSNHMELSVSLKDTMINAENSVKYLKVIITNLNFHNHLTAIELKISRAAGVSHKFKFVLNLRRPRPISYPIRRGSTYPIRPISEQSFLSPKQSHKNAGW